MFKESKESMIKWLINGGYHRSGRNYKKRTKREFCSGKKKTTKTKMGSSIEGLNSRFEVAEGRTRKLWRWIESMQPEEQKEKKKSKEK